MYVLPKNFRKHSRLKKFVYEIVFDKIVQISNYGWIPEIAYICHTVPKDEESVLFSVPIFITGDI